ncbi:MAG: GNAT family N-acetyltransferase [Acidimicrobiia bacterium]
MVAQVEVVPMVSLPDDVERLARVAEGEEMDFVRRLIDDWGDGSNRFDQPDEVLLGVISPSRLVGVGGLNRDPYLDDPSVGRIRHVYIEPGYRGRGVGRELVGALVDRARGHFARVRLRVSPLGSPDFYLAIGFSPTTESDATHTLRLTPHGILPR